MVASSLRLFTLVGCLSLLMACSDIDEHARFDTDDDAGVPECIADVFPFEPDFLSARTHQGRTGIFLQSSRDVHHRTDVVLIQFYDDTIPEDRRLELHPGADSDAPARAKMAFFSSCPDELETLELRGTVAIEEYDPDDVLSGHLVDAYAVDARSEETVIESISGSWRLQVRRGVPYQDFFALPEPEEK